MEITENTEFIENLNLEILEEYSIINKNKFQELHSNKNIVDYTQYGLILIIIIVMIILTIFIFVWKNSKESNVISISPESRLKEGEVKSCITF